MKITLKNIFTILYIFTLTCSFIFAEETNIISHNEPNLTKNIETDSKSQNDIDEKIDKKENNKNLDLKLEKKPIISTETIETSKEKIDQKSTPKEIKELEKFKVHIDTEILQNSLLILSKKGQINLFKQTLKENNLYINWQNEYGMTALLEATKANQEKMIKLLIKLDAEPKIASKNNVTNLRFAVENNNKSLVKLFLKYGLEVGSQDINGQSPLLISIEKNFYEITKILLDNIQNFDVDLQDKNGRSLLMAATENNDVKLVKKLISKNANIWLVNSKNEDALTIAEKHSNKNLIKILKAQMEKDRKKNPKIEQWIRKN